MVPRTASIALSHALVPYLELILGLGIEAGLASDPALTQAVNLRDGQIVLPALRGWAQDDSIGLWRSRRKSLARLYSCSSWWK